MPGRFQFPSGGLEPPTDGSSLPRIIHQMRHAASAAGRWAVLAIASVALLSVWLANIATCFGAYRAGAGAAIRSPRAIDSTSLPEVRLAVGLSTVWSIAGGTPDSLQMWVLDDSTPNAASLGDGRFVAWTGLETLSDSDLIAIFAHEVAHDRLHHSRRVSEVRDVTDYIGEVLGIMGGNNEATSTLKNWSGKLVIPRYSRSQEFDADARGIQLLAVDGDTAAVAAQMCSTFARLRDRVGEAGGGWFVDHPALAERIVAIRRRWPSDSTFRACHLSQ